MLLSAVNPTLALPLPAPRWHPTSQPNPIHSSSLNSNQECPGPTPSPHPCLLATLQSQRRNRRISLHQDHYPGSAPASASWTNPNAKSFIHLAPTTAHWFELALTVPPPVVPHPPNTQLEPISPLRNAQGPSPIAHPISLPHLPLRFHPLELPNLAPSTP